MDNDFVVKQKRIFNLFIHPEQVDPEAEYYHVGKDYDIEAHIDDYSVGSTYFLINTQRISLSFNCMIYFFRTRRLSKNS